MRRHRSGPCTVALITVLLAPLPALLAADTVDTTGPIPEVVRIRFAEAAKGAELRNYSIEQRGTKTFYSAVMDDPLSGKPQRIEVPADGSTARIEPIEANTGERHEQPPVPPAMDKQQQKTPGNVLVIPDEPNRSDGKDVDPQTRRGREEAPEIPDSVK